MPVILAPEVQSSQLKLAVGTHTFAAAVETIQTGLRHVLYVTASMVTDQADTMSWVTAAPGTAGAITLKGWRNTTGTDPTPVAIATTFGQVVHWMAVGY
jgi:hypothetical protein